MKTFALVAALAATATGGCGFGQNGIAPPADRVFLPGGIVADPLAPLLYVVNSNSDLRFNAGTIAVVDLTRVQTVRQQTDIPICSKTRFSRTENVPGDFCCRDLDDSNIVNCAEPQFIQADATVALGSFGGDIELQLFGETRRLFVAVRAEPSITFADVAVSPDGRASLRCTGVRGSAEPQEAGAYCDDGWKVRRPGGATPGELVLPEEPHTLVLDETAGILYVGHSTVTVNNQVQGGGVSTLDVCNPADPGSVQFAGLTAMAFAPGISQAVAALSSGDPANPEARIYATARYAAAVSGLALLSSTGQCDETVSLPRDLTLVPAEMFYSPAFLPRGADVRGILFSPDGSKAFVLHRNAADSMFSPAALVALDRARRADGTVMNTPTAILQLCNGPTEMQMHDTGEGRHLRIYVTCYDEGQIYVVDPATLLVTAVIDTGAAPTHLVFSKRDPGVAFLASFANSHLSVIDINPTSPTENRVILRIGLPHGFGE